MSTNSTLTPLNFEVQRLLYAFSSYIIKKVSEVLMTFMMQRLRSFKLEPTDFDYKITKIELVLDQIFDGIQKLGKV